MKNRIFLASVIMSGLAVTGIGAAYAASAVGPPTQNPGYGQYNYSPGTIVYGCVNQSTETVRVEIRTQVADNCKSDEVQIAWMIPAGAYPAASATPTPTAS